jgi:hypothetical protein
MVQWILGVDQLVRQPPGVTITDADFISANSHVAVDETSTLAGSVSIEGAPELQASQSLMLVSGGYEAPSITITNAGVISVDPQPRQEVYLLRENCYATSPWSPGGPIGRSRGNSVPGGCFP